MSPQHNIHNIQILSKITQPKSPENEIQLQGSKHQPWDDSGIKIIGKEFLSFFNYVKSSTGR